MAGTLVPFDQVTGKSHLLPGCEDYLPELKRDFRLVVTTGDGTASARGMLASLGVLDEFEEIYGDLFCPVGKPYGEILREMGAEPGRSLAVGDRLRADIAADSDQIVTLLINQDGDVATAGVVTYMTHLLRKQGTNTFCQAFDFLAGGATPDEIAVGSVMGGSIVEAWHRNDGFAYRLWVLEHPALKGQRRIIVI